MSTSDLSLCKSHFLVCEAGTIYTMPQGSSEDTLNSICKVIACFRVMSTEKSLREHKKIDTVGNKTTTEIAAK